jgi:hypothetical protein
MRTTPVRFALATAIAETKNRFRADRDPAHQVGQEATPPLSTLNQHQVLALVVG